MFTDGNTTIGAPPAPVAAAARAQGIIIYCIGLIGSDGLDITALNDWATDPDASHVAVTPNAADLEELFAELAATMLDAHSLQWNIAQLGVTSSESAVLDFFIRHVGQQTGTKLVNESITYSDKEGNVVSFPKPMVSVECDIVVHPEPCPEPVELTVEGCQDSVLVDLGDVYLESQGRIIQMDVTIQNVCPGKRVALAAILTEVDKDGMEHQRGMKAFTIPAHSAPVCRDVLVKCIKFVVPEDLSVSGGAMCSPRKFKARFLANNIDTDYRCCESTMTL